MRLAALWGALGIHIVRLLFGSHWAPRDLVRASQMLDHKNTRITEELYCAKDLADCCLDEALPARAAHVCEVEQLRRELADARALLAQIAAPKPALAA